MCPLLACLNPIFVLEQQNKSTKIFIFLTTLLLSGSGGKAYMGEGRVHHWMGCQFIAGPYVGILCSVPCSRVPWKCSEGVLAPLPTARSPSIFLSSPGLEPRTRRLSARSPVIVTTNNCNLQLLINSNTCDIFFHRIWMEGSGAPRVTHLH